MRDIGYLERELLRIKRENENNANIVKDLRVQIKELQEHISHLTKLIQQQVKND
jgi:phage host-nuclease inhibitor protein Gam